MRDTHPVSKPRSPESFHSEAGELYPQDQVSACCHLCGGILGGALLETLRHIALLPNALGSHACERGHPEMRLLPDGTRHCPACGSEVLNLEASTSPDQ